MYPEEYLGMGNYAGEIRQGPDGQLYQWHLGVDGLGHPVGFWKAIRSVGRAIGKGVRAVRKVARIPIIRKMLPVAAGMIPGIGPAAAAGIKMAQQTGILGLGEGDYLGELREDGYGNLYQWEEGMDGLGNPVGFWKYIKSGIRRITSIPEVQQMLPSQVRTGLNIARRTGLLGYE